MNLYFQKKFRPVFALFFAVFTIALLLLNSPLLVRVNGFFILVVNGILFVLALINYLRLSKLDRNNPNALVRSMMSGTMIKFIVFGGAALWYALQKKAPI
jgi:predicted ABC-type exoprotein transport system permease subunit